MQAEGHQGRNRFSISCSEFPKRGLSLPLRMAQGSQGPSSSESRVAELKGSGGMEGLTDTAVTGQVHFQLSNADVAEGRGNEAEKPTEKCVRA